MKRIALSAALGLAFASSLAFAQQPQSAPDAQQPPAPIERPHGGPRGHHAPDPHREAMMLSRRLNLTPDQTAKVEPIFADRQQKLEALHANASLPPEELHQQMFAIRKQERTQLEAMLTPEQQQELKAMHHGRRGQFRGQPGTPSTGL